MTPVRARPGRSAAVAVRGGLCVLTLHRVVDRPIKDHDISTASFARLVESFASVPAPVCTDLTPAATAEHGIVLTFDDGTADHAAVGEHLARIGLRGVFFVPAAAVDRPGYLTEREVERLTAHGHVVGSHANEHRLLAGLSREELETEVVRSKDRLAGLTGGRIEYFAPPGGVGHPLLAEMLAAHGFAASRSTRWGVYRSPADRWEIPSIPVTELTLRRGWVASALSRWDLPLTMRAAWRAKAALPTTAAVRARSLLHAGNGSGR